MNATIIQIAILVFGILVLWIASSVMNKAEKKGFGVMNISVFVSITVIIFCFFLVTFNDGALPAATGLIGAVLGFVSGRIDKGKHPTQTQDQKSPPQ